MKHIVGILAFLCILGFFTLIIVSAIQDSQRSRNNKTTKEYSVAIEYKNGDKDTLIGSTIGDKRYPINFEVDRDYGSECLYMSGRSRWTKLCCGIRKYTVLKQ